MVTLVFYMTEKWSYHNLHDDTIITIILLCGKVQDDLDHIANNISRTCQLCGEVGIHVIC